jgi:hypothetical protein
VSVVLAPDYWYLQGFAPGEMQKYVDHMGFMAYDLRKYLALIVLKLGSSNRWQTVLGTAKTP